MIDIEKATCPSPSILPPLELLDHPYHLNLTHGCQHTLSRILLHCLACDYHKNRMDGSAYHPRHCVLLYPFLIHSHHFHCCLQFYTRHSHSHCSPHHHHTYHSLRVSCPHHLAHHSCSLHCPYYLVHHPSCINHAHLLPSCHLGDHPSYHLAHHPSSL